MAHVAASRIGPALSRSVYDRGLVLCNNCAEPLSFPSIGVSLGAKSRCPDLLETLIVRNIRWSCWSRKPRLEGRRSIATQLWEPELPLRAWLVQLRSNSRAR